MNNQHAHYVTTTDGVTIGGTVHGQSALRERTLPIGGAFDFAEPSPKLADGQGSGEVAGRYGNADVLVGSIRGRAGCRALIDDEHGRSRRRRSWRP